MSGDDAEQGASCAEDDGAEGITDPSEQMSVVDQEHGTGRECAVGRKAADDACAEEEAQTSPHSLVWATQGQSFEDEAEKECSSEVDN